MVNIYSSRGKYFEQFDDATTVPLPKRGLITENERVENGKKGDKVVKSASEYGIRKQFLT